MGEYIQHFIGRFSRRFRHWYWVKTDHQYLWGFKRFVRDDYPECAENESMYDPSKFLGETLKDWDKKSESPDTILALNSKAVTWIEEFTKNRRKE